MDPIKVRRTRHVGHCWRSRDELISDDLLWTSAHGRAKAGQPRRTYIQLLCKDTGCNTEDQPETINDRKEWGKKVRDIRVGGMMMIFSMILVTMSKLFPSKERTIPYVFYKTSL